MVAGPLLPSRLDRLIVQLPRSCHHACQCLAVRTIRFLLFSVLVPATASAGGQTPGPLYDNVVLNYSRVNSISAVDGLFLTDDLAFLLAAIKARGGVVVFQADDLGYVRARLPIERYRSLASSPKITASRLNGPPVLWQDVFSTNYTARSLTTSEESRSTRLTNIGDEPSLFASQIVGQPQFIVANSTYDGRGVGIGILEQVAELNHPSLQDARDLAGHPDRKVAAIINSAVPNTCLNKVPQLLQQVFDPGADPNYVTSLQDIPVTTDSNGWFSILKDKYRGPPSDSFLLSNLYVGGFDNRIVDSKSPYAVLWKRGARRALIDGRRDGNFQNALVLRDFNETGDIGYLPRTIPAGGDAIPNQFEGTVDSGPLAIAATFDECSGRPHLWSGDNAHTTMVAGIAAGSNFAGTPHGSSAPNARLIYVAGERGSLARTSDSLEGAILAARRADVDLLSSSLDADDIERSGSALVALLLNRLTKRFGKPIFWGAGNDLGLSETTGGAGNASQVVSVGGYTSSATIRELTGYELPPLDRLMNYSRGPARNGAMKPDLVAPSLGISPTSCSYYRIFGTRRVPPCYFVSEGTSAAAPAAASIAAALISGAKQLGIPFDAARVTWAMKASARFLDAWPAHAQGAGLVNLPRAWDLLLKSASWSTWRFAPHIEVRAPINNRWLPTMPPGSDVKGVGLYEREGWTAGQTGERTITLVRRSGPLIRVHYGLVWRGNDGTFASTDSIEKGIDLPLDRPVPIRLKIAPATFGVHSATLELFDAATGIPVHWISSTIVAAHPLDAHTSFVARLLDHRDFLGVAPYFVAVAPGTAALRAQFINKAGQLTFEVDPPLKADFRVPNVSFAEPAWGDAIQVGDMGVRIYPSPAPGVWQFLAFDPGLPLKNATYQSSNSYSVEFAALAVDVRATNLSGNQLSIRLRNKMSELESATTAIEVGAMQTSVIRSVPKLQTPRIVQILVGDGISTLQIQARSLVKRRRLKMYLYYCGVGTTGECKLWDVPLDKEELIAIRNPTAGKWKVLVEPVAQPEKGAPYMLTSIQTGTKYGNSKIKGIRCRRQQGEVWTDSGEYSLNKNAYVTTDVPVALVEVRDLDAEEMERTSVGRDSPQRPIALGRAVVRLN